MPFDLAILRRLRTQSFAKRAVSGKIIWSNQSVVWEDTPVTWLDPSVLAWDGNIVNWGNNPTEWRQPND